MLQQGFVEVIYAGMITHRIDYFTFTLEILLSMLLIRWLQYIQDVLAAFTSFKIDGSQTQQYHKFKTPNPHPNANKDNNAASQHRSRSSINVVPKVGDDDLYFPKYLTNRRLLELQMGDPNFRRYFMVQLLIILQYLTTPVKFKR